MNYAYLDYDVQQRLADVRREAQHAQLVRWVRSTGKQPGLAAERVVRRLLVPAFGQI